MEKQVPSIVAELLYHHDCVIIPGFGGFVARHVPASVHPGLHSVFPPSKSVLFNKNLVNNDGLLANALIEQLNLSYTNAVNLIGNFAEECHRQLHQNLRLEMDNIGVLYLDTEKNIQFEPQADMNYLLHSFGLSAVYAHPVAVPETKVVEIKEKAVEKFVDRKEVINEKISADKRTRTRRLVAAAIASPFVIGLAFLLSTSVAPKNSVLAGLNPFGSHSKAEYKEGKYNLRKLAEQSKKEFYAVEEDEKIILNENGHGTLTLNENMKNIVFVYVKAIDPEADKTKVQTHKKNTYNSSNQNVSGSFQVVLGCFSVKDNAERLVHNLNSQNINAGISGVNNKGLFVVSAGGFDTKDSAKGLLENLRSSYPNAWIMAK